MKIIISYFFGQNTIPLGLSCARALRSLGHDVFCFDSGISSPVYDLLIKPANKILRAAGRKNSNVARNSQWHTQKYRERKLEKIVSEYKPEILLIIRGHGFDPDYLIYLKEKYRIRKTIGWWVKGPKWIDLMKAEASAYDLFYCIHKEGYSEENNILHLPAIALDDSIYMRPILTEPLPTISDITFVGSWSPRRQEIINELRDFKVTIYGTKWLKKNLFNHRIRKMIKGDGIWGRELTRLYNQSKICLNISQWNATQLSGLNLRVLDIPACGGFLLTESSDEINDYFIPGKEVETYSDIYQLKEKISYYLQNEKERELIASRGYEKACCFGTYVDKMRLILQQAD